MPAAATQVAAAFFCQCSRPPFAAIDRTRCRLLSHTAESVRSSNGKRRYGSFVLYSVVRTTSGATGRVSFRGHRSRYPSTKREISSKYFVTVQKEHRKFFSLPRLCTNKEVRGEEVCSWKNEIFMGISYTGKPGSTTSTRRSGKLVTLPSTCRTPLMNYVQYCTSQGSCFVTPSPSFLC
jgi:hypothetical protein